MIEQESLLVTLVRLVERIPVPPPPTKRPRGRPKTYPGRLFLKALVIMIVRHLHTVHELLTVLEQETPEMRALHPLLTIEGQFPTRRTWERRLQALPDSLPAQIGTLGRHLVALIAPWAACGRAAAIDSTGCSYRVWWIIPGLNRLSELNFGDRAQIGSYQPCPLQSFFAADSASLGFRKPYSTSL
jgi:hypothetical protein